MFECYREMMTNYENGILNIWDFWCSTMGFFGGFPHVLQTNPQSALPAGLRMQDVGHMQGKAGTAVSVQMGTGRVLSGNMLCVICVYVYIYIPVCVDIYLVGLLHVFCYAY